MLRRAAIRAAQVSAVSKTRSFATSQLHATTKKKQPSAIVLAAAGVAAVSGLALTDLVNAREKPVDLDAIKKEIIEIFDEDNYMGPTMVRLAWHSSGSYSAKDNSGGSTGGTIRFDPEINHGGNAGVHLAVKALEKVKKNHPEITYADPYILAGVRLDKLFHHPLSRLQPRQNYINKVLYRFAMDSAKPTSTPMVPKTRLDSLDDEPTADELAQMRNKPYRQVVGSLLYLASVSRTDLAFAVNQLARHCSNPRKIA